MQEKAREVTWLGSQEMVAIILSDVAGFAVISSLLSQFAQHSVTAHLPSWQRLKVTCETKQWLCAWLGLPPPL